MISVLVGSVFLAAAFQAPSVVEPRQQLVQCLMSAVDQAVKDKIAKDAFQAFAKNRCTGQMAAFRQASVAYDTKMGSARQRAESDADGEISDHLSEASDKLQDRSSPQ